MNRLTRYLLVLLFAATTAFASSAYADAYPDKPIHLIVPLAPGGTADILGRILAQKLGEKYHQSVVVDNKAGAGGNIGAAYVANSAPDGYTLLFGTIGIHASYQIYKHLSYDPSKDLVPVILLAETPNVLVVSKNSELKSTRDIIETSRKHPGSLNFGSAGFGSSTHISGELFKYEAQVNIMHVPYKGSAPADTDLIAGRLSMIFENLPGALPFIQAGTMRALAITSTQRADSLPNVPTVAESGLPGYTFTAWFTIAAPSGTPRPILDKLNKDIMNVMSDPAMKPKLDQLGVIGVPGHRDVDATKAYIDAQRDQFGKMIEAAHLVAD